jgi:hypothetical protein
MTGFMPHKPRFVSGVKRNVYDKQKLNSGKPRLVGGKLHFKYLHRKKSYLKGFLMMYATAM